MPKRTRKKKNPLMAPEWVELMVPYKITGSFIAFNEDKTDSRALTLGMQVVFLSMPEQVHYVNSSGVSILNWECKIMLASGRLFIGTCSIPSWMDFEHMFKKIPKPRVPRARTTNNANQTSPHKTHEALQGC